MPQETLPTDPRRVRAFANFFKNYMSVSSVVVAALPIPVTAFGALPTFADHKAALSTYTSLFCFLLLGFIFYLRHALAKLTFPEFAVVARGYSSSGQEHTSSEVASLQRFFVGFLLFGLIAAAALLAYLYHSYLDQAVFEIARNLATPARLNVDCTQLHPVQLARDCVVPPPTEILAKSYIEIPWGFLLRPLYIGMFVFAEAAFILMATREYIQDLLQLSDVEVILGHRFESVPEKPPVPNIAVESDAAEAPRSSP